MEPGCTRLTMETRFSVSLADLKRCPQWRQDGVFLDSGLKSLNPFRKIPLVQTSANQKDYSRLVPIEKNAFPGNLVW